MSFFGLFGGNDKNCECNKVLKDHLKKCAGYGERPPLIENCCAGMGGNGGCPDTDLGGPPKCTGNTPAPKCNTKGVNKLVVFIPTCEVPATASFKCPGNKCGCNSQEKPKCCPPPEPSCNKKPPSVCPQVCTADGKCKPPGGGGGCGGGCPPPNNGCGGKSKNSDSEGCNGSKTDDFCSPRPLKM